MKQKIIESNRKDCTINRASRQVSKLLHWDRNYSKLRKLVNCLILSHLSPSDKLLVSHANSFMKKADFGNKDSILNPHELFHGSTQMERPAKLKPIIDV